MGNRISKILILLSLFFSLGLSAQTTYEYYSPVQPLKSIMLSSIYSEDIHGDIIKDNEKTLDKIKSVIKEIDPNIDFIELVQTSTPDTNNKKQLSLQKNGDLCSGKFCVNEFMQDLMFLRDPFLPVAVFKENKLYTEINVLSNYSCIKGMCSSSANRYKLKSILGTETVFTEYPSINQNAGGNLLSLPARTFLSINDGESPTKGSAFMYSSKFNHYKKIVLDGDELMGIGHVDEVIQVIPDPSSRCGVALIVASPRLFVEKFGAYKISFLDDNKESSYKNPLHSKIQDLVYHIGKLFEEKDNIKNAAYIEYYKNLLKLNDDTANYSGIKSAIYANKDTLTFKMIVAPYVDALEEKIQKNVDRIRNHYVCPAEDHIAKIKFKEKDYLVKDSIRLSKPDTALSVFNLPVMWLNGFSLIGTKSSAASIFPNFINSIIIPKYEFHSGISKLKSINIHILMPDAYIFSTTPRLYTRKIIEDQYLSIQNFIAKKHSAAGLKIEYKIHLHFIDSSFYGVSRGELHCASNEIRRFFFQEQTK